MFKMLGSIKNIFAAGILAHSINSKIDENAKGAVEEENRNLSDHESVIGSLDCDN